MRRTASRWPAPTAQRGAALLVAMVVLTLVTTLASAMVWQQWRGVQVEAAERARTQAAWMLIGAADWGRLLLSEDGKTSSVVDELGETWATPLAEARLSSFLATDGNAAGDGPEAFLSGRIVDLQSRYNLRRLARPGAFEEERRVLRRLCGMAGLSAADADQLAQRLAQAWDLQATDGPLRPRSVDQLAWFGVPPAALARLSQWTTVLPRDDTAVNVNTASREVLLAVVENLDPATADRLIASRPHKALPALPPTAQVGAGQLSVNTSFFEILAQLRLDDRVLRQRTVIQRSGSTVTALSREPLPLEAEVDVPGWTPR
ncbi:type II secretion system minor pseudopilin GspK [Aquabacterium sp. J223]|uniref:type II secretion system minor pseudopilin GspK n=1 Tax=Aquabacterium sp. J223 TaxID=2898431 RepID=UPI0021ADFD00|nr:type II secretion system minor pseudopilin GspK [Aquabacterium sp. J223]UUX96519.1 type II secretion system minor pseudopilin GspK [Aquabacterium sp. J223]